MSDNMNFLTNLETLLKGRNMTKADLSRELKIPASTISSWTRNSESINLTTLRKISSYFNVSLEELINGTVETVTFTTHDFSSDELILLVEFSKFLLKSRCK